MDYLRAGGKQHLPQPLATVVVTLGRGRPRSGLRSPVRKYRCVGLTRRSITRPVTKSGNIPIDKGARQEGSEYLLSTLEFLSPQLTPDRRSSCNSPPVLGSCTVTTVPISSDDKSAGVGNSYHLWPQKSSLQAGCPFCRSLASQWSAHQPVCQVMNSTAQILGSKAASRRTSSSGCAGCHKVSSIYHAFSWPVGVGSGSSGIFIVSVAF